MFIEYVIILVMKLWVKYMFKRDIINCLLLILFLISISPSFANVFDDYAYCDDFENSTYFYIAHSGDFSFSLRSNPSTRYSWNYSVVNGDVSFINKTYLQDEAYMSAVGVPGQDCFNFRFDIGGFVEMEFSYARPWEDSLVCKKRFIIFVC